MNDLLTDPKSLALTFLGALMALLTWIGKGALRRIEELEKNAVTRPYVDQKHEENRATLSEIKAAVTATHRRIDDLYRDFTGKDS